MSTALHHRPPSRHRAPDRGASTDPLYSGTSTDPARAQAAIGGADPFEDWLSWSDEGKEWRRVGEFDEAGRRVLHAGDRVEAQPYC